MRLSYLLPGLGRWGRAALALGGLAVLPGCDFNFWRMDGHQTTMIAAGPVATNAVVWAWALWGAVAAVGRAAAATAGAPV